MKIKLSFGIIVLNGEPYTRYCLRALYAHAHQIIVVEGACPGSITVSTIDGHSTDGTLGILQDFCENEDPDKKVIIITAEDEGHSDGFWSGEKDEMSRAYARRVTGNYLWQIDVDEFYHDSAIEKVKTLLFSDPSISAISFRQLQFWGGFQYLVDSWLLRRGAHNFHRLFKWEEGYIYKSHRPPTVFNKSGTDLREINWITAEDSLKMGLILHHYSFVFPKQVIEKAQYYKNAEWSKREKADWWANDVFMKLSDPFRVFSVYWDVSWIKRFRGEHPSSIKTLIRDIESGKIGILVRQTGDIEQLLRNPAYCCRRAWYILLNPFHEVYHRYIKALKRKLIRLKHEYSAP